MRACLSGFSRDVSGKYLYRNLKPDAAYLHPNYVTVNRPVGAANSSSLGAVDWLISMLERSITRALKTIA